MTRQEVRDCLGNQYREFKRNEFAENSSDQYTDRCFIVEYDSNDICNAVEFHAGAQVIIDNHNVLAMTYDDMRRVFDLKSNEIEVEDEASVTYHDLGFSASKESGGQVQSILMFNRGYWEF